MMLQQIGEFIKRISLTEKILYLYIVLIPVMKVPYLPLVGQKIQYSELVFLFLLIYWMRQLFNGSRNLVTVPLKFALSGMLIIFLLSFIPSKNWLISALEYAGILYLAFLYALLCQLVDTQELWRRLIKCWCFFGLLIALTGIAAYFYSALNGRLNFLVTNHDYLGNVNQGLVLRLTSIFRHPAMLTMYLHVSIVFGFVLANTEKNNRERLFGYLVVGVCFVAAILTKTRCNAGIALTVFLALAYMAKENIYLLILRYLSFIYAVILMVMVIVLTVWWVFPVKLQRNPAEQTVTVKLNTAYQVYFIQHLMETKIIKDYPWTGVGLGMSNAKAVDYIKYPEVEKSFRMLYPDLSEDQVNKYKISIDPHSLYLGLGAETGFLGLGALLFFIFKMLALFFKKIKQEKNSDSRYICGVFLAGLLGFLFNSLYVDMLSIRAFWFMIAMGVIYAGDLMPKKRNDVSRIN